MFSAPGLALIVTLPRQSAELGDMALAPLRIEGVELARPGHRDRKGSQPMQDPNRPEMMAQHIRKPTIC